MSFYNQTIYGPGLQSSAAEKKTPIYLHSTIFKTSAYISIIWPSQYIPTYCLHEKVFFLKSCVICPRKMPEAIALLYQHAAQISFIALSAPTYLSPFHIYVC